MATIIEESEAVDGCDCASCAALREEEIMPNSPRRYRCTECSSVHPPDELYDMWTFMNDTPIKKRVCLTCKANYSLECPSCNRNTNYNFFNRISSINEFLGEGVNPLPVPRMPENPSALQRRYLRSICNGCLYQLLRRCRSCSLYYGIDHSFTNGICEGCSIGRIENYSSRVDNTPIGRGPHFKGVELEVEVSGDCSIYASRVKKSLKEFVLIKRDGSLSNGFEIVTRPASMSEHVKRWTKFFEDVPLKGMKSWSTSSCGLHIHCSRAPLTPEQIARIVCFINASWNRRFMFVIAGRSGEGFSKYKNKKYEPGTPPPPIEKYEAVNLLHNDTIEFRIFKGTLKKESLFKAIEFTDALIHFTAEEEKPESALRRTRFIAYVNSNKKKYPHLWAFIEAKWFGRSNELTEEYGYKPIRMRDYPTNREGEE
jgi:hypothetical protein